jgi:plasmid stabilization system protein ParE
LEYLEKKWNYKIAEDFLKTLDKRIDTLKKQPRVGKSSIKKPGIRAILITKHNRLYYKFNADTILVLNMYDTRSNPKKNPY